MLAVLTFLLAILALAGCSTATPLPSYEPVIPAVSAPTGDPVPPPANADPIAVHIPSIGANSTLIPTGILADGSVQTPPETAPMQASWLNRWPKPGDPGPAIVLGHVNGQVDGKAGQPGIFARLHEVKPGAEIVIDRKGVPSAVFVVYEVTKFSKAAFPHDRVYDPTDDAQIRVITCGGVFDHGRGSYVDNWVVFGRIKA